MPQTTNNGPTGVQFTGNDSIDGLLWGWQWSSPNLTFRFPEFAAEYQGYSQVNDFAPMNVTQQNQLLEFALNNLSAFTNITWTYDSNFGGGNIRFANAGIIDSGDGSGPHFPGFGPSHRESSAEAVPPSPEFPSYAQGDNWFTIGNYAEPVLGSFQYAAGLLHEVGHSLGLKHGHAEQGVRDANGNVLFTAPQLPAAEDSQNYSVMTYSQYQGQVLGGGAIGTADYPWTYMMNDVAALQHLYGANFTTANVGDTTYSFDNSTGQLTIDTFEFSAPYRGKVFATMWDGGGNDTYDFSNHSNAQTIDLNPGEWMTFSQSQLANLNDGSGNNAIYAEGNIANAYLYQGDTRSLIENVNTSSGNDHITGNQAGNRIEANGGKDTVFGGAGADTILGGGGNDYIVANSGFDRVVAGAGADQVYAGSDDGGNDTMLGGSGNDTLGGGAGGDSLLGEAGNDQLFGGSGGDFLGGGAGNDIAWAGAGNDTIWGGDGADVIGGGAGNDTLAGGNGGDTIYAGSGNDTVNGAAGNDAIFGGSGNDTLEGGAGNDTMYGGGWDDTFKIGSNHGDDFIGGFETKGNNTIDLSDLNLSGFGALSVSNSGGDAVIDTGAGTITLWSTAVSDVTASDFIF